MCGGCPACGIHDQDPSDEYLEDLAMQHQDAEDAEPSEFLDGCLFRDR
jgi:hypothetical protein